MATMNDIAKRLGIAVSTVSKALNGSGDISETTRQQVLKEAVQIGYAYQKVKKSGVRKICVITEEDASGKQDPFLHQVISGFQVAAAEHHWQVTPVPFCRLLEEEGGFHSFMVKHDYTGAFFPGFQPHRACFRQLEEVSFPLVVLNGPMENPFIGCVDTDFCQGVYQAVEHLCQLGHQSIAFFNGADNREDLQLQKTAYRQALASFGRKVPDGPAVRQGRETLKRYAARSVSHALQQAIVCAGGGLAAVVLSELSSRGVQVPEEISVVGVENLSSCEMTVPALTTVQQDCHALGRGAFFVLEGLCGELPIQSLVLSPCLIVRESAGPVNGK